MTQFCTYLWVGIRAAFHPKNWKLLLVIMVSIMVLASNNLLSAVAHSGAAVSLGVNPISSGLATVGPGAEATLIDVPSGQEFILTNYKITYSGPSGYSSCISSKCDLKVGGEDLGSYIGNNGMGVDLTLVIGAEETLKADNNNGSCSAKVANCLYYFDGYFVQE